MRILVLALSTSEFEPIVYFLVLVHKIEMLQFASCDCYEDR